MTATSWIPYPSSLFFKHKGESYACRTWCRPPSRETSWAQGDMVESAKRVRYVTPAPTLLKSHWESLGMEFAWNVSHQPPPGCSSSRCSSSRCPYAETTRLHSDRNRDRA